jgi:cytochrome c biogenesis protein ResB
LKSKAFWKTTSDEEEVERDPKGKGPPAYRVRVGERAEPAWLQQGRGVTFSADGSTRAHVGNAWPLGFSLTLNDAVAEFWPASNIPRAYYSDVSVSDSEPSSKIPARIETNAPLHRNGYRLYQSSMDPDAPYRYSIFSVAKDAGVPWVTLGFLILTFGLLWLYGKRFVVEPIRASRRGKGGGS